MEDSLIMGVFDKDFFFDDFVGQSIMKVGTLIGLSKEKEVIDNNDVIEV